MIPEFTFSRTTYACLMQNETCRRSQYKSRSRENEALSMNIARRTSALSSWRTNRKVSSIRMANRVTPRRVTWSDGSFANGIFEIGRSRSIRNYVAVQRRDPICFLPLLTIRFDCETDSRLSVLAAISNEFASQSITARTVGFL